MPSVSFTIDFKCPNCGVVVNMRFAHLSIDYGDVADGFEISCPISECGNKIHVTLFPYNLPSNPTVGDSGSENQSSVTPAAG